MILKQPIPVHAYDYITKIARANRSNETIMSERIQHRINFLYAYLMGFRYFFDDISMRKKVIRKDFTIISAIAVGSKIYQDMGIQYRNTLCRLFCLCPLLYQVIKKFKRCTRFRFIICDRIKISDMQCFTERIWKLLPYRCIEK